MSRVLVRDVILDRISQGGDQLFKVGRTIPAGSGLTVTIKQAADPIASFAGAAATHYTAATGGSSSTGAITASASTGAWETWLDPGRYDISYSGTGISTVVWRFEAVLGAPPASGDTTGVADTAALRAAITATGAGTLKLVEGATYYLAANGTKTFASTGVTTYNYCLELPSNFTLDTNGATLKLAAGQTVAMAMISSATGATDVGLIGYGTCDGNNVAITDGALVWFDGTVGVNLDIKLANTVRAGLSMPDCSYIRARRIVSNTNAGVGIGLGTSAHHTLDSWFGYIEVRNTTAWTPNTTNFPGNPLSGSLKRCVFDTVKCYTNTAAIKLDLNSEDALFGTVYIEGCSTVNSGFKFQGSGTGYPARCHINHLHARANAGNGLFMDQCTDCSVGTYTGDGNATAGSVADVWIGGTRDRIAQLHVGGSKHPCVEIRSTAVDYRVGTVSVRQPAVAATGVQDAGGTGVIERLVVRDTGALIDRGYRSNSANSVLRIGHADITGATVQAVQRTAGDKVSIGQLRAGTTDLDTQTLATDAIFTLTPGTSPYQTIHTGALTANRAVTLSTTGVYEGLRFRISRKGSGAFTLDVGTGPLKSLAVNTWCEVIYDGAAWVLSAYGTL